ncbi:ankyrin repeat protein [Ilyonectria robusta]
MSPGILRSTSYDQAISVAKIVFGIPVEQVLWDTEALGDLSNLLEDKVPKKQNDNFKHHIDRLSQPQPLVQVLQWAVFLSSNARLSNEKMDGLLRWTIEGGHRPVMEHILRMTGSTVMIFASNLLLSAIRVDDLAFITMLLEQGIGPNSADSTFTGKTALQTAVLSADSGIVQQLLDHGADVNGTIYGPFEHIPPLNLFLAQKGRPIRILEILIAAGADVNHIEAGHLSALQAAVSHLDPDMVSVLLEAGADVNMPVGEKYKAICTQTWEKCKASGNSMSLSTLCTPLSLAASYGHKEIARLLLKEGANINGLWFSQAAANQGLYMFDTMDATDTCLGTETPLQLSVRFGHLAMIKFLLDAGANTNTLSIFGSTALQDIFAGDLSRSMRQKVAHLLLGRGATVNIPASRNLAGMTPVQEAARLGDFELVSLFVDNGADLNAAPYHRGGRTAVQAAAESGEPELVIFLINSGAAINADAAAYDGLTCLQAAASTGNLVLVDKLLQWGASVNAPASTGSGQTALQAAVKGGLTPPRTPLAIAVSHSHEDVVKLLISSGADLNQAGLDDGANPLHHAFNKDKFSRGITKSLIRGYANPNEPSANGLFPIHLAATCLNSTDARVAIKTLIDAGADVNTLWEATTALQIVVEEGHERVVKMLLDAGADVNCQPGTATALQRAVEKGHKSLVEMLLDAGADINAPAAPSFGTTALQAAVKRDDLPLVRDLVSRGADVNAPPSIDHGATALQLAAINGNINMAILLLEDEADVNAAPAATGGRTALQGAAERGRLYMIYLLLENDKEMESMEERCQDAARFAEANHHPIIAKILLEWKRP